MSNYPNMSYCMCQNTRMALEQILDAMDDEGDREFVKDLSRDELRSFEEMLYICQQFADRAERALESKMEEEELE